MNFLDAVAAEAASVPSELHQTARWTRSGGGVKRIDGIYRRVSEVSDIGALVEADGIAATLNVADSAVPGIALADPVEVGGDSLRVVGLEPAGLSGRTLLVLGV